MFWCIIVRTTHGVSVAIYIVSIPSPREWRDSFQIAASLARSPFFLQVVYKSDEDLVWVREVGLLIAQDADINISERIRKCEDDYVGSGIHTVLDYVSSKQKIPRSDPSSVEQERCVEIHQCKRQ